MANLKETAQWEEGIYQLETSDPVLGGENGIDNKPARQLANRTVWLKQELRQTFRQPQLRTGYAVHPIRQHQQLGRQRRGGAYARNRRRYRHAGRRG